MKKQLLLLAMILLPMVANANVEQIGGIYYNLIDKGHVAEVTKNPSSYAGTITIPPSVTASNGDTYDVKYIGEEAFATCIGLTDVSIPNSVTTIGDRSFAGCRGLTKFQFPTNLTNIGQSAFSGCNGLTSLTIPNSVTIIGRNAFESCTGLTSINMSNNITVLEDGLFQGCTGLVSFDIPNNVTQIKGGVFDRCTSLASITIPDNVTEVLGCFRDCENLSSVTFGEKVFFIGGECFRNCKKLTSIVLPNSVRDLGGYAFVGSGLTTITAGTGLELINMGVFSKCADLKDFYCYADKVPQLGADVFKDSYVSGANLYVYKKMVAKYQASDQWKEFNIVGLPNPKHNLTYYVDDQLYKGPLSIEEEEPITPEPEPTKEGYTFSGWTGEPSIMPEYDVDVKGYFTINKYTLTYMVDDEVYKNVVYTYGATITPEPDPQKEGYTFSGWSTIPTTMPAKNDTIRGSFTVNEYTLTYMIDGEVYKIVTYKYGESITPEPAPTKEGYTFKEWVGIPTTMPARDIAVTASFTPNPYTLTYIVDDVVYKTYTYLYATIITPEPNPEKEGYTFSGWSEIPETMPAHDVTVTGSYTVNKYKLIYMIDSEEYRLYELEYGAAITPEPNPEKEGYTFSGWSEIPETMPAHDVTVTGTFTINKYKLIYMVDDAEYKSYEIEYGSTITPEPDPIKEGYTFGGWSTIPAIMPANDVTVTGSFTINKYKLIYMVDDIEYKSYDVEYGAAITPEAEPTKEGYTFSGWINLPRTMPAHDVTVTGSFTKGAYKLTYMVDDEVYKTMSYNYGETITPEPDPEKEGYTFSGWSNIPQTMPAYDVTVTGSFKVNKYNLIYMVDGEVYKNYEVEFGAKITPEPDPVKDGYAFSGWSWIPSRMPAEDVTITGTFTKNEYDVNGTTYQVDGDEATLSDGTNSKGNVEIPTTIEIEGTTYKVTSIADNAFSSNTSVTSIIIPEGIVKIGDNAFNGCSILLFISIGKDITEIGEKAFANIGTSTNASRRAEGEGLIVECYAESVPTAADDAFEGTPINSATLLVNDNFVSAYKATMPWSKFGTIMGFNEAAGIKAIWANEDGNAQIFSLDGKPLNELQKGVNIVRMSNGQVRKVVVK